MRVLTASGDKTARVWDVAAGRPLSPPLEHRMPLNHAAFGPDGDRVVTSSFDSTAQVWEADTGQRIGAPLKHTGVLFQAQFSPDGTKVATASADGTARLWDAATGKRLTPPLKHRGEVHSVAFTPDGQYVATASGDTTAQVWDVATGAPVTPPLRHGLAAWESWISPDGKRLIVRSDKENWAWSWDLDLTPPDRPLEDVVQQARLLAGRRLDDQAGIVNLTAAEVRSARESLRAKYPADFAVTPRQAVSWHRSAAAQAQRAGQWRTAVAHLTAAIATGDVHRVDWELRGNALAELGRWDEAVADYGKAIELVGSQDHRVWFQHGLLLLTRGDTASYRSACDRLLERFGRTDNPLLAGRLAWCCKLSPDAVADPARLVELAELAVADNPQSTMNLSNLAGALYRAGRYDEAVRRLNECTNLRPGGSGAQWDWIWLAMTHHELGETDRAQDSYKKAGAWIDQNASDKPAGGAPLTWSTRLELQLLRREAELMIRPKE